MALCGLAPPTRDPIVIFQFEFRQKPTIALLGVVGPKLCYILHLPQLHVLARDQESNVVMACAHDQFVLSALLVGLAPLFQLQLCPYWDPILIYTFTIIVIKLLML